MAGDCPHNTHLETTLKQCHAETSLVASTHESYLKIIDDLKNDLDQISCEVIMVQKECNDQDQCNDTTDVDLEISLKELETQNDRLERALKLETQNKEAAFMELQTNNESLKCQIAHLQRTVFEREQHIMELTSMLKNISQIQSTEPHQAALEYVTSRNNFAAELEKKIEKLTEKLDRSVRQEQFLHKETRKLNQELSESKRKNGDLISQAHRLGGLLKSQESHRMELAAKYETLEQNFEDQAKKLCTANNQLCMLNERFQIMEKRQNEHNMERNLLREEVLSLKEKLACAMGRQKSLEEQLQKTEKELYNSHDVINEQKSIMQSKEISQNEAQRRCLEANTDLKRQLAELVQDYKKLQEEYDNQKEIISQQSKLIENFQKWKKQQLRAENTTRESFKTFEDYIKELLKEKKKLRDDFRDLYKDYSLLQNELDRFKACSISLSNFNNLHNSSERSIAERLEIIRRTTHHVSEQSSSLKEEEPSATSTAYRPSEEPL